MKKYALLLLALVFLSCNTVKEHTTTLVPGTQTARSYETHTSLRYLLYLPQDYDPVRREGFPAILFLHGAGERGDSVEAVATWGPPRLAREKNLPFIVISPQCPKEHWWTSMMFELKGLLDQAIVQYNIDTTRIYLTGLSMGGYGTFAFSLLYPDYFAAVAPICGGGTPSMVNFVKDYPPIWVFHGNHDKIVPVESSTMMVEAMKNAGFNVKYTIYESGDHYIFKKVYADTSLFNWFLAHRKVTN